MVKELNLNSAVEGEKRVVRSCARRNCKKTEVHPWGELSIFCVPYGIRGCCYFPVSTAVFRLNNLSNIPVRPECVQADRLWKAGCTSSQGADGWGERVPW